MVELQTSFCFQKLAWLLQQFEGFQACIYTDLAGNSTIGYGHKIMGGLLQDKGLQFLGLSLAQLQAGLSSENASRLLAYDVFDRANIQKVTAVPLSDPLWVSLSSFCFNVCLTSFLKSQAYKAVASQNIYDIANSLSSWREVRGTFSPGIAKRRLCEVFILMQKPLSLQSLASPSEQWSAPVPFLDDTWHRLSPSLKQQVVDLYNLYQTTFSPIISSPATSSSFCSSIGQKIKLFLEKWL